MICDLISGCNGIAFCWPPTVRAITRRGRRPPPSLVFLALRGQPTVTRHCCAGGSPGQTPLRTSSPACRCRRARRLPVVLFKQSCCPRRAYQGRPIVRTYDGASRRMCYCLSHRQPVVCHLKTLPSIAYPFARRQHDRLLPHGAGIYCCSGRVGSASRGLVGRACAGRRNATCRRSERRSRRMRSR